MRSNYLFMNNDVTLKSSTETWLYCYKFYCWISESLDIETGKLVDLTCRRWPFATYLMLSWYRWNLISFDVIKRKHLWKIFLLMPNTSINHPWFICSYISFWYFAYTFWIKRYDILPKPKIGWCGPLFIGASFLKIKEMISK